MIYVDYIKTDITFVQQLYVINMSGQTSHGILKGGGGQSFT